MARIGSIDIEPGIMNAACSISRTTEDVEALSRTAIGAIVVGSITHEARDGNPKPRWYTDKLGAYALNSFGMPNGGIDYYRANLPLMIETAHGAGKPLILSIGGFCIEDYARLARLAEEQGVDMLEVNLGCPNALTDSAGQRESIASFNPYYMTRIVHAMENETDMPVSLKLSPYSNPAELKTTAEVINGLRPVDAIVTMNTFPNGVDFDESGSPVLAAGLGGVSGAGMRPIALGQVQQFRHYLDPRIEVIGVGGIENRGHVESFLRAGAVAVQAATLIVRDGYEAISRLV